MQELESKSAEVFQRNRDLQLMTKRLEDELNRLEEQLKQVSATCTCGAAAACAAIAHAAQME